MPVAKCKHYPEKRENYLIIFLKAHIYHDSKPCNHVCKGCCRCVIMKAEPSSFMHKKFNLIQRITVVLLSVIKHYCELFK